MNNDDVAISVIVPVYNSEPSLSDLNNRLVSVLKNLVEDKFEIIFVNDGSTDSSWSILKQFAANQNNIVAINLTRNFGQHNALMCGFKLARGSYIITIDDDLQIPPEEMVKLFQAIQEGHDVVYGIYGKKEHSIFRNFGSKLIQFVFRKTFNVDFEISAFRIMTKQIVEKMLSYEKSFSFIDGLIVWHSTCIHNISVAHNPRQYGISGYSLKKLLILALNMLTNFSIVPLQIASLSGIVFAFSGFFLGFFFLLKKLIYDIPVSGFTSTVVILTIFSGVQLLTVGILGEYIGRIHINVNNRPQYAIRDVVYKEEE